MKYQSQLALVRTSSALPSSERGYAACLPPIIARSAGTPKEITVWEAERRRRAAHIPRRDRAVTGVAERDEARGAPVVSLAAVVDAVDQRFKDVIAERQEKEPTGASPQIRPSVSM
jgi:hypothetical protein